MRHSKVIQGIAGVVTHGYNAAYSQDPITGYEYQHSNN
jgi:hypothetical protein